MLTVSSQSWPRSSQTDAEVRRAGGEGPRGTEETAREGSREHAPVVRAGSALRGPVTPTSLPIAEFFTALHPREGFTLRRSFLRSLWPRRNFSHVCAPDVPLLHSH